MAYDISLSENKRYVVVHVTEPMTRKLAAFLALEASVLGEKHQLTTYLYDLRQSRNVDSDFGNYQFTHEDMQKIDAIRRNARVALLTSPDDDSHDFVELVSRNAGYLVYQFKDKDEAIAWLLRS